MVIYMAPSYSGSVQNQPPAPEASPQTAPAGMPSLVVFWLDAGDQTAPLRDRLYAQQRMSRFVPCPTKTCLVPVGATCRSSNGNNKRDSHLPRLDASRKAGRKAHDAWKAATEVA